MKDLRTGVEKGNPEVVLDGDLDGSMAAALAVRAGDTQRGQRAGAVVAMAACSCLRSHHHVETAAIWGAGR